MIDLEDIKTRKRVEREAEEMRKAEWVEAHSKLVNKIFTTEEGKKLWKELCKYTHLYHPEIGMSNEVLRELAGRRQVQLDFIYKYLSTKTKRYLNGASDK
jgi:hypothetical protein